MTSYLVDTSVLVEFLNGNIKIRSFIDSLQGEISTSFVCVSELYEGVYLGNNPQTAEIKLLELCSGFSQIYNLNLEISKEFGKTRTTLRKSGQLIEDLDILIAATALKHDLTLVTLNIKHFSRIPGLKLQSPA